MLVSSVAGSRSIFSQFSLTTCSLRGSSSKPAMMLRWSKCLAANGIVFFSPLPPIISGMWSRKRGSAIASCVRVVLAGERRPLAREHRQDDLQRLAELVEAVGEGAEVVAERVVLELEPAGADAEDRAALADHVERGDRLGQQRRVAVGVAGDQGAELHASRWPPPARRARCTPRASAGRGCRGRAVDRSGPSRRRSRSRRLRLPAPGRSPWGRARSTPVP